MTSEPCMCGDPYCPRCGNPEAAAIEEAIDKIIDDIQDRNMTPAQVWAAWDIGLKAIDALSKVIDESLITDAENN